MFRQRISMSYFSSVRLVRALNTEPMKNTYGTLNHISCALICGSVSLCFSTPLVSLDFRLCQEVNGRILCFPLAIGHLSTCWQYDDYHQFRFSLPFLFEHYWLFIITVVLFDYCLISFVLCIQNQFPSFKIYNG